MIMERTVNVSIGGCAFTLEEDAFKLMKNYLKRFKDSLDESSVNDNVMIELEGRVADLLRERMRGNEVATVDMVQEIIDQIGYPEGYTAETTNTERTDVSKKFFRDSDDKKIAGVCSGLALYFGVDVVLIRVIFLVALFCGTAGFWAYVAIWIVAPETRSAADKCALRGLPQTQENLRRFTSRS